MRTPIRAFPFQFLFCIASLAFPQAGDPLQNDLQDENWDSLNLPDLSLYQNTLSPEQPEIIDISLPKEAQNLFVLTSSIDGILVKDLVKDEWEIWKIASRILGNPSTIFSSPEDPNSVYIGSERWAGGSRIVWTEDGGETWNAANLDPDEGPVLKIAGTLTNGDVTLFVLVEKGSVFRSLDRGLTWNELTDHPNATGISTDPKYPERIFIGSVSGLFLSKDRGETWQLLDNQQNEHLMAAGGRVYCYRRPISYSRSDDLGLSWDTFYTSPRPFLEINHNNPNIIYASFSSFSDLGEEIYSAEEVLKKSIDGGDSWETIFQHDSKQSISHTYQPHIRSFALNPTDPTIAYLATKDQILTRKFSDPEFPQKEEIEEQAPVEDRETISTDHRRGANWTFLKSVNLGPIHGNAVGVRELVVDEQENRIFVANRNFISVIDLQTNSVVDVIKLENVHLFENRDGNKIIILMIDHNLTPEFMSSIVEIDKSTFKTSTISPYRYLQISPEVYEKFTAPIYNRFNSFLKENSIVYDEDNNAIYRLEYYVSTGTNLGISPEPFRIETNVLDILDLETGIGTRTMVNNGPMLPDLERNVLYVLTSEKVLEIYNLSDLSHIRSVPLELGQVTDKYPVRLLTDPTSSSLFLLGMGRDQEHADLVSAINFYRINFEDGSIDSLSSSVPLMSGEHVHLQGEIDESNQKLWVLFGSKNQEDKLQPVFYKIDLLSFEIENVTNGEIPLAIVDFSLHSTSNAAFLLSQSGILYHFDEPGGSFSAVELAAFPAGIAVSKKRNRIFVSRGEIGGIYVVGANGYIQQTLSTQASQSILLDDTADRLYAYEREDLRVYELSTLRSISRIPNLMEKIPNIATAKADYTRGFIWAIGQKELVKLDMFTGTYLGGISLENQIDYLAVDSQRQKAYLVGVTGNPDPFLAGYIFVSILDLENEEILETIKAPPPYLWGWQSMPHPPENEGMAFDPQKQQLFIRTGQIARQPDGILVFDAGTNSFVEGSLSDIGDDFEEPTGLTVFDLDQMLAFMGNGQIVNLENNDRSQSFLPVRQSDRDPIRFMALNSITNTLYTVRNGEGLSIFLGPAGTEIPPPLPPAKIAAESGDGDVVLTWSPVEDIRLIGYNVYRRDRIDADFIRITHAPISDTTFVDADLLNGQTYSYKISSTGQNNLESLTFSDSVFATPGGGKDFRLIVLRRNFAVARGDSLSIPISLEAIEGFSDRVQFSAEETDGLGISFFPIAASPPRVLEIRVKTLSDTPLGKSPIQLQGQGGDRKHFLDIEINVSELRQAESQLTLELDEGLLPIDIPLSLTGRLFPATVAPIQLLFESNLPDTSISHFVEANEEGEFQLEFIPPYVGHWDVTASWSGNDELGGAQSGTTSFEVISGSTRITCASDLADTAGIGWTGTIKGRIYPNPGTVALNLHIVRPDGHEETIEGLLSSADGFYGYDLKMDTEGFWRVWSTWQGNDLLLGAVSPVVVVPVQVDVGRAILCTGGEDHSRNRFWSTSNYLGNLAYNMFAHRRFPKEKVFYLNSRQNQDVNQDGFEEDVDSTPSTTNLDEAWTWAKDRISAGSQLFVYLVGNCHLDGFEVRDGEILSAAELEHSLSALEAETGALVTVIIEGPHSGHFTQQLSQQGRHVITSADLGLAYYLSEGYMSFSQYFLTGLRQGKSLQEAFLYTHRILRNIPGRFGQQRPGLEAEGNSIVNQTGDYLMTADSFIGAPFEMENLAPQIKSASLSSLSGNVPKRIVTQSAPITQDNSGPSLKLARSIAEKGVEIFARIDDPEGKIKVARAMIIPPIPDGDDPQLSYPEVELTREEDGVIWKGIYGDIISDGIYPVIVYAIDDAGNIAEPLRTTIQIGLPDFSAKLGDFNGDGVVDFADFFMFADGFGLADPAYDLNGDGQINYGDFFLFADAFEGALPKLLALAEELLVLPKAYSLNKPFPNPFNHEVVVEYALPQTSDVEIVIFNTLGQRVRILQEQSQSAGYYKIIWDGRNDVGQLVSSGIYVVKMKAHSFHRTRKLTFLK